MLQLLNNKKKSFGLDFFWIFLDFFGFFLIFWIFRNIFSHT
tara:strand:+ start:100 stop:222 length:123 start_codon:yes stop_codon:yes gene_type:complete